MKFFIHGKYPEGAHVIRPTNEPAWEVHTPLISVYGFQVFRFFIGIMRVSKGHLQETREDEA